MESKKEASVTSKWKESKTNRSIELFLTRGQEHCRKRLEGGEKHRKQQQDYSKEAF